MTARIASKKITLQCISQCISQCIISQCIISQRIISHQNNSFRYQKKNNNNTHTKEFESDGIRYDTILKNVVAAAVRYDTVFYSQECDGAGQGRAGLLRVLGRISQIRSEGREERRKEGKKARLLRCVEWKERKKERKEGRKERVELNTTYLTAKIR